eukprot:403339312
MTAPDQNNFQDQQVNNLRQLVQIGSDAQIQNSQNNVKFNLAYEILDSQNNPGESSMLMYQDYNADPSQLQLVNQRSSQSMSKQHKKDFNIKKFKVLKQKAEKEKAEKKMTVRDEYESIMNRLENVNAKDLKSKIKNYIDDSYQQRNLIEAQKFHNQVKNQINEYKYKSPVKKIKKLDLQTLQKTDVKEIVQDTFDRERELHQQNQIQRQNSTGKQISQQAQTAIQVAYQRRIQEEQEEEKKRKMIDLKLNHMVSNLQERLGFVTKKQKMDHVMNRLASTIEKRVKQEKNEMTSKIQKQEFDIQDYQDNDTLSANIFDGESFQLKPSVKPQRLDFSKLGFDQEVKHDSVSTFKKQQLKQAIPPKSIISLQKSNRNQTQQNTPAKSSRYLESSQQKYSNRFKSLSPKKNQEQNPYNKIIKEKILDKTPRAFNPSENNFEDEIYSNLVLEFLQSLYSDKEWTGIANDEQFEKIMSLLSDYYGMNESKENKYQKLPRFLLAQRQSKMSNRIDENHIGSDIENRSRLSQNQKISSLTVNQKNSSLIPNTQEDDNLQNYEKLNILSDDDLDIKRQNKEEKLFEKLIKQMHLDSTVMKEKFVMERYTSYLNKCMFISSDDFIKRKFKAFMDKKNPKQSENFFTRMQKDQNRRNQQEKLSQELMNQQFHNQNKLNQTIDSNQMDITSSAAINKKYRKFLDVPDQKVATNKNVSTKYTETSLNVFSDHYQIRPSSNLKSQEDKINIQIQSALSNSFQLKLNPSNTKYEENEMSQQIKPINYAKIPFYHNKTKKPKDIVEDDYKTNSGMIHDEYQNLTTVRMSNFSKFQNKQQTLIRQAKSQQQTITHYDEEDSLDSQQEIQIKIYNHDQGKDQIFQNRQITKIQSNNYNNAVQQVKMDTLNFTNNDSQELSVENSPYRRSHMKNLKYTRLSDIVMPTDAIEEKIRQLQNKVLAKKSQQLSPIKIRIM